MRGIVNSTDSEVLVRIHFKMKKDVVKYVRATEVVSDGVVGVCRK